MNIPVWIEFIASVGVLIAGLGYAWGQFRDGQSKAKIDSITILEADVKNLRGKVEELTTQVQNLTTEIGIKDKKLADALAILQGYNPNLQKFIDEANHYITFSMPVFDRMNKFLDKQIL